MYRAKSNWNIQMQIVIWAFSQEQELWVRWYCSELFPSESLCLFITQAVLHFDFFLCPPLNYVTFVDTNSQPLANDHKSHSIPHTDLKDIAPLYKRMAFCPLSQTRPSFYIAVLSLSFRRPFNISEPCQRFHKLSKGWTVVVVFQLMLNLLCLFTPEMIF